MAELKKLWQEKGFGRAFQAFIDGKFPGKERTVREALLRQVEGEFFYHELMHGVSLLLEEEAKNFASPERLLAYAEELLTLGEMDVEELKIDQDLTRDAVNILTLYASKGLEYGVVFALGLIKRVSVKEEMALIRTEETPRLAHLFPEEKQFALHMDEIDAEKMRQLYVAMTRAKHRLYLPCISGGKAPKRGGASPLELFLARLGQPAADFDAVYERLQGDVAAHLTPFLEHFKGLITCVNLNKQTLPDLASTGSEPISLQPPKRAIVPGQQIYSYSFTSLSPAVAEINRVPPHDFNCAEKTPHSLPAGSDTGVLLHEILENIPFHSSLEELPKLILPFVQNTPFEEWLSPIVEIIGRVLCVPLGGDVRLSTLKPQACFREMEFLFPADLMQEMHLGGFMSGIVDLAFEANGKYYLIDWKSNWLGPDISFYTQAAMQEAMTNHHYDLQAKIYLKAFEQYLKQFDARPFGGVFYLFLRGIDPARDPSLGVLRCL